MSYRLSAPEVEILRLLASECGPVEWIPTEKWRNESLFESLSASEAVDILPDLWAVTPERSRSVRFAFPIFPTKTVFILPSDQAIIRQHGWFSLGPALSPFSTNVWLALAILLSLCMAVNRLSKSQNNGFSPRGTRSPIFVYKTRGPITTTTTTLNRTRCWRQSVSFC